MRRGAINSAAEVVWYGREGFTGSYESFLYRASTVTVTNLSNTPSVREISVMISENGDVTWSRYTWFTPRGFFLTP